MALTDRLWVLAQLAEALKKARKFDEALSVIEQGQAEAITLPVQQVYFARLAIANLNSRDMNQPALAEYTKIAPMLPDLAGSSGELDGRMEAANASLAGGTVMSALGQLPEAMDLLMRALRVFDGQAGQAKGQAECLNQIAHVHFKTGDVEAASRQLQHAIDIAEPLKAPNLLARRYMRKAHFMSSTGNVEAQHEALIRARTYAQKDDNPFNLAVIATNLADVALQKKDDRASLRYVEEALLLVQKSGDRESLPVCWINKGIALNRLGQKDGLALLKPAIDECSSTPGQKNVAAQVQGTLAEELAFNRDFERAYEAAMDFKKRVDAAQRQRPETHRRFRCAL